VKGGQRLAPCGKKLKGKNEDVTLIRINIRGGIKGKKVWLRKKFEKNQKQAGRRKKAGEESGRLTRTLENNRKTLVTAAGVCKNRLKLWWGEGATKKKRGHAARQLGGPLDKQGGARWEEPGKKGKKGAVRSTI